MLFLCEQLNKDPALSRPCGWRARRTPTGCRPKASQPEWQELAQKALPEYETEKESPFRRELSGI